MNKAVTIWIIVYACVYLITMYLQHTRIEELYASLTKERMEKAWHAGVNDGLIKYLRNYPVLVINPSKQKTNGD